MTKSTYVYVVIDPNLSMDSTDTGIVAIYKRRKDAQEFKAYVTDVLCYAVRVKRARLTVLEK
jgi:hypothetical protein